MFNFFGLNGLPFLNDASQFLQSNIVDPLQGGLNSINEAIAGPQVFQAYDSPIGPMPGGGSMPSQTLPQPTPMGNKDTLGLSGLLGGALPALGGLMPGQEQQQQPVPSAPMMPQQQRVSPMMPNQSQSMLAQRPTLRGLLRS